MPRQAPSPKWIGHHHAGWVAVPQPRTLSHKLSRNALVRGRHRSPVVSTVREGCQTHRKVLVLQEIPEALDVSVPRLAYTGWHATCNH